MRKADLHTSSKQYTLRLGGAVAALAATIILFSSGQIYLGNTEEFGTPYALIIGTAIIVTGCLGLIGAWLGHLLSVRVARRAEAVVAALTLLCWVQGTFLFWDYGVLDGRAIQWGEMTGRGLIDATLWTVVLLFAVYGGARMGQLLVRAAYVIIAIQGAGLASQWLEASTGATAAVLEAPADEMFEFSPDRNVLHIVLDGFQADIFSDIVSSGHIPGLEESLDGFTFFANHMGAFPYTQLTMPLIVSGNVYRNDLPVQDFTAQVMGGDNVLNAAMDAEFEVDIAAQPSIRSVYAQGRHSRAYAIPQNMHASDVDYLTGEALRLTDLSLFRVAPHFLRFLIHQDELWLFQRLSARGLYPNLRYFSEVEFLRRLRSSMTITRSRPTYKLFHLMLSHRPTVGTSNCDFDGIKETSRESVTDQSLCGLKSVMGAIERMKELGIYDDALIVLMADHGAWIGPRDFDHSRPAYDGPKSSAVGLAVPMLAIKPPSSRGRLAVTNAPSEIGDVARTISTLAGFEVELPGRNLFELSELEARIRYFYDYAYGDNTGFLHTLLEYQVDGSPFDDGAWTRNRRIFPGGEVESIPAN